MLRTLLGTDLLIEQQSTNAFNLDTVLLAHFVKIPVKSRVVLDVGTGNGALMLYLSQKTNAKIIGIEIQEERYLQAIKNIEINQLSHRLSVLNEDYKEINFKDVDCIISNPPFFKVSEKANLNKNEDMTIARHEIALNLENLIIQVTKHLKFGGHFFMIHRPDRIAEIIKTFAKYQLEIKRIRFVHPYLDAKANHVLIEATKNGNEGLTLEPPLILYIEKHIFTKELIEIYGGKPHVT
jgi:tRNA1(Val) A37 N6-methylase TrmN6